ncbi:HaeIII family restriction endonuclease [Rossellomorea vietnamensis]|uniref:HaeIII family restriction endonuclease n=1 Tax=Rossellomorea vietnamensis TaxID=218284 RepID=UPI001E5CFA1C|nr:HaeIII family restriction endonuclease [Rossellomorea vietnamensis]MCC5803801.1 HaeIII family restriction endonuclease [Rossellomorea vietnamensis]
MSTSTDRGYGFEYTNIQEGMTILNGTVGPETQTWIQRTGNPKYNSLSVNEQQAMIRAARTIINFLTEYEPWLLNGGIEIAQVKAAGGSTDVSDVRFTGLGQSVGLSLKSNHDAVRHPRVSPTIDIAHQWLGVNTDQRYLGEVAEIFNNFTSFCEFNNVERFNQLSNEQKKNLLYSPITACFSDLLLRVFNGPAGPDAVAHFLRYLIGDRDFYKAKADFNRGELLIEAYDFSGTMGPRHRLRMPTRCLEVIVEPGPTGLYNYINITFDRGWEVKMRLHTARTAIENSLKWDVQFVGTPRDAWNTRIRF